MGCRTALNSNSVWCFFCSSKKACIARFNRGSLIASQSCCASLRLAWAWIADSLTHGRFWLIINRFRGHKIVGVIGGLRHLLDSFERVANLQFLHDVWRYLRSASLQ